MQRYAPPARTQRDSLSVIHYAPKFCACEMLLITPHAATELVDRLCAGRLLTRRKDASDRRRFILTLTPKAERILHSLSVIHLQEIRQQAQALFEILRVLVRK